MSCEKRAYFPKQVVWANVIWGIVINVIIHNIANIMIITIIITIIIIIISSSSIIIAFSIQQHFPKQVV